MWLSHTQTLWNIYRRRQQQLVIIINLTGGGGPVILLNVSDISIELINTAPAESENYMRKERIFDRIL